jgi:sialic acid synthase SpsE
VDIIKIDGKKIGLKQPCFTIAEAGANHDGTLSKAKKLIDAAVKGKADSIKFQTYKASKLTTKSAPKYWDDGNKKETQFDVFKKLDSLTNSQWAEIFEYAKKKKITCFSTPFDEQSVDLLYSLDVPAFKIASADITHLPLIKYIARKKLPIFISTGMASNNEIKDAVNTIEDQGNSKIIIMHCITSYPTKPEDANLNMIQTLHSKFPNYIIGFSDHTLGTNIGVYSTFYGAMCLEKHFTFNKNLKSSPDHKLSLDINDFLQLKKKLREVQISKGNRIRKQFNSEAEAVKFARRSIVSTTKIKKGEKITKSMLDVKRPGTGIPPKFFDKIIGYIVIQDVQEDMPLEWKNIQKK